MVNFKPKLNQNNGMWIAAITIPWLPLVFETGRNFEYEYSLLTTLMTWFLFPLVHIISGKKPEIKWHHIFIIPLLMILISVSAFFLTACPCNLQGHFFWIIFHLFPTATLTICMTMLLTKIRKIAGVVAFISINAVLITDIIGKIWFFPQKRILHPVFSFWHGPIYDELILVDKGIIALRFCHYLFFLAIFYLISYFPRRKISSFLFLISTFFLNTLVNTPSVNHGLDLLKNLFTGHRESEGFTLHFMKSSKNFPIIDDLFWEASFHYKELSQFFFASSLKKIDIFVYPNSHIKKLWFGGHQTDITDVFSPSIHISEDAFPHPTLRHELVHAIASKHAFHGLGFHPNMAFTEGLAIALAPSRRLLSLDSGSGALLASGKIKEIEDLFTPVFWSLPGDQAYTVAGSLINFIKDKYSAWHIQELYAGTNPKQLFDQPFSSILAMWETHVKQRFNPQDSLITKTLFSSPGPLHDICPHSKLDLQPNSELAWLMQPINWTKDSYQTWLKNLLSSDRNFMLQTLLQKSALSVKNGNTYEVNNILKNIFQLINRPPLDLEDAQLLILASDLYMYLDQNSDSHKFLAELEDWLTKYRLGDSLVRSITARVELGKYLDPINLKKWLSYLAGWSELPSNLIDVNDPWIISYLILRRQSFHTIAEKKLIQLLETHPPANLSNSFGTEWFSILGFLFFKHGNYEKAANSYLLACQYGGDGQKKYFEQMQKMMIFFKNARKP